MPCAPGTLMAAYCFVGAAYDSMQRKAALHVIVAKGALLVHGMVAQGALLAHGSALLHANLA